MIRILFKTLLVALLVFLVFHALLWIARLVGPDVEPYWTKLRDQFNEARGWKRTPENAS